MSTTPPYTVFISYKGDNAELANSVKERLEKLPAEVIADWDYVRANELQLHTRLRDAIYSSDLVVALLTEEAVSKPLEIIQELVIAHEWKVPILTVGKKAQIEGLDCWFLKDANRFETPLAALGRDTASFLDKLETKVDQIRKDYPSQQVDREIRAHARKILESLERCRRHKSPAAVVALRGIQEVSKAAKTEAQSLANPDETYEQNLSLDNNFLIRAAPSFDLAEKIYAISMDQVSEFWRKEERVRGAIKYLESQTPMCRRLFVLQNPLSAHQLRYVLAAHHRQYGAESRDDKARGGVFLCNRQNYFAEVVPNRFLGKSSPGEKSTMRRQWAEGDFGILEFQGTVGGPVETHELRLTGTEFSRRVVDPKTSYVRQVKETFEKQFMEIDPGQYDKDLKVVRWKDSFATNQLDWKRAMEHLFTDADADAPDDPVRIPGRVFHFVFFHRSVVERGKLKGSLHKERDKLNRSRDSVSSQDTTPLEDLYFANHLKFEADDLVDFRYKGKLNIDTWFVTEFPFALITPLRSSEALEKHYTSKDHSESRQEILTGIDPEGIGACYERLEKLVKERAKKSEWKREYESIEARASRLMLRADYQEYHDLEHIVQMEPFNHGWKDAWERMPVPS